MKMAVTLEGADVVDGMGSLEAKGSSGPRKASKKKSAGSRRTGRAA